jgi:hypothetical protein
MGGGKETPRQKMVGLMYLVLMALLALNVTKAVLDAFVAIEKNLQVGTLAQLDRGDSAVQELIEATQDKTNPEKVKKVKYYLTIIDKINKITGERIAEIDKIKIDCLAAMGENVVPANGSEEAIVWKPYDAKKDPNRPALLHLMAVQAKDGYDVPMHEIIGQDLTPVTGSGKALWENYNKYRGELCELVGTYQAPGGNPYKFKTQPINKFKDNADLEKLVEAMFDKNGKDKAATYNINDDREILKEIYIKLSKNEYEEHEGLELHWIARTFDHSPIVAALASLTAIQQEILGARATALQHIKGRVSTGEYSFNKVMAISYGAAVANAGEEVEIGVMMAAFDSDNQPIVTSNNGQVTVADGRGTIKVKVSAGNEMKITGTVAIKKKSGDTKTEPWEHTVLVMKPQGTVSLPEMRVLYRGYKNVVEGVASGYDKCDLKGSGVNLAKSGTDWIASPGTGRECEISIIGMNSITKKNVPLGTFKFRVSNLPPPAVYLGTLATGSTPAKAAVASMTKLFAKYPPEIPLAADFEVASWEVTVSGAPRSASGNGAVLSAEAISMLKQARSGAKISISAKYKGMGYTGFTASVLTVQ